MSAVVFIPLTQGQITVIDFEDFEKVRPYKWCAHKLGRNWYAETGRGEDNCRILMHRFILNAPAGAQVDHVDGNGLNNQRSNTRLCSMTQNQRSFRRKHEGATSRFRGVSLRKSNCSWRAHIRMGNELISLGSFKSEKEAARAYDAAARKHFGKFASPNFSMRYTEPKPGEWVQPVMRGYRMMCCDCGLVHEITFKVVKHGRGHKVKFQVFRNERATAAARRRKMNEPLFKADGSPSEKTVQVIKCWPVGDYGNLMGFVKAAWSVNAAFEYKSGGYIRLFTGGFSGNEDLVRALSDNRIFWATCWRSSHRGGLFVFHLPT